MPNKSDKWASVEYREMAKVRPDYEWLRFQVGLVSQEQRVPLHLACKVFTLVAFGRTGAEAQEMAERRLGE